MRKLYSKCQCDALCRAGVLILLLIIAISTPVSLLQAKGKEDTPDRLESYLEQWVNAYQKQNKEELKTLYELKSLNNTWVEFECMFFQSIGAPSAKLGDYEILYDGSEYLCVGVGIIFKKMDGELPVYERLVLKKNGKNAYIAVGEDDFTQEMRRVLYSCDKKMKESELYKDYAKREKKYQRNHSGLAKDVYNEVMGLLYGLPDSILKNYRMMSSVFALASVELLLLVFFVYLHDKRKKDR